MIPKIRLPPCFSSGMVPDSCSPCDRKTFSISLNCGLTQPGLNRDYNQCTKCYLEKAVFAAFVLSEYSGISHSIFNVTV